MAYRTSDPTGLSQTPFGKGATLGSSGVAELIAQLKAALGNESPASGGGNFLSNLLAQQGIDLPAPNNGPIPTGMGGIQGLPDLPFMPPSGSQGPVLGPPVPEQDPYAAALAEIDALINAQGGGGDNGLQAALHQATSGIKQAYGSQIGAIKDLNQDARQDTRKGSKEVRAMYRALQKSYNKAGQREKKQGANTAAQLQRLGAESAGAATNAANEINAQNVAAAQALGAPNIAEQLNAEVNAQQQAAANEATSQAGRSARTALGTSGNEQTYYNTQGTTSRLEGTNRAADMYAQLQDYLEANGNKIGEIAGQRAQALAGAKASIGGAYAKQQGDTLGQMIAQKMKLLEMAEAHRESMTPEEAENPLAKMFPGMFLSNQIAEAAPPPVQSAFQELLNDPAMASGQWNGNNLAGNLPAIQQWLLDNRETDAFENDPNLMAMLQAMIAARLQGHPGPAAVDPLALRMGG